MISAKQLIESKGNDVWTVNPHQTVYEAISIMADRRIGALLVMDGHKLVGIINERHYARNVVLKGKTSPDTLVGEIMDRRVVCARPEQNIHECMNLMTQRRVRYLPVLEKGKVIGVISIGDLVKSIIEEKSFIINELQNYISGTPPFH